VQIAKELQFGLLPYIRTDFDITQSIGKRYRRQDEIGTPLCITADGQTLTDGTVTIRCRDAMTQIRMHKDEVMNRAKVHTLKPSLLSFPSL
jgi:glycyl-tRNA synthetase